MASPQCWIVVRAASGFFLVWGQREVDEETVLRGASWAEASNTAKRLNAVRAHFGPAINATEADRILVAYEILVERGDMRPVAMTPDEAA